MTDAELQEEEREVLLSIYDGDAAFKQLDPTTYQYKYGENDDVKSFLLEITWGPKYPSEKPNVNMNTFYNKHIVQGVKDKVAAYVDAQAEQWLGSAMTYTLFQSVQENLAELIIDQPDSIEEIETDVNKISITGENVQDESLKKVKKEQLTKAQKRRQWNKADGKGEKPRGWDWMDIVKHLSQTSSKQEYES